MTVLVTGGAGYIGSHMVLELLDADERVVVVDNLSNGFRWAVAQGAELVVGDIADQRLIGGIIALHDVDAVIHFAGSIVVPDSDADPRGYYLNNTVKSRALIEAAVKGGVRNFIFSSTAAVYGMPEENPVGEDAPLIPISPYGSSKMMTEIMLKDTAHAHDLAFVALRYFNVCGADPKGRSGQSTPRATHLIKWRARQRSANAAILMSMAPTTTRLTAPASATTSMSAILPAPTAWRLPICEMAARAGS